MKNVPSHASSVYRYVNFARTIEADQLNVLLPLYHLDPHTFASLFLFILFFLYFFFIRRTPCVAYGPFTLFGEWAKLRINIVCATKKVQRRQCLVDGCNIIKRKWCGKHITTTMRVIWCKTTHTRPCQTHGNIIFGYKVFNAISICFLPVKSGFSLTGLDCVIYHITNM